MEVAWHQTVCYEFNFIEIVLRLMGRALKNAAMHSKGLFDAFRILRSSQIIFEKALKDLVIFFIIENDSFFNPFIIYVGINSFLIFPIEIFGRHSIIVSCKKRLCKYQFKAKIHSEHRYWFPDQIERRFAKLLIME